MVSVIDVSKPLLSSRVKLSRMTLRKASASMARYLHKVGFGIIPQPPASLLDHITATSSM